jgi:hypothetical protein
MSGWSLSGRMSLLGATALLALPLTAALHAPAPAGAAAPRQPRPEKPWAVQQEATRQQTFTLGGAPGARSVTIDNFSGSVEVRAHAGNEVSLRVHETWYGDSAARIELGRRAVRLDAEQSGEGLRIRADGPFRSPDGGIDFHGWRALGYEARFDLMVEVPAGVSLSARTVNNGDVRAEGLSGHFDLGNVNGAIGAGAMTGAGRARTVNGTVEASFSRVPAAPCEFATVNGRIDVSFPAAFAADLRFKTVNGEVYTDFPYTYSSLPPADEPVARREGRHQHRYGSRGEFAARIAGGGPKVAFATVNGDILIHRREP